MKQLLSLYKLPLTFIVLVFAVKCIEVFVSISFAGFGVVPLSFHGFFGIFLAPLIHGSWLHLFSNTMSLIILSAILFYKFYTVSFAVFFVSFLFPGLLTWIIGDVNSVHIGASGIVYAFSAFMIFIGFFTKQRNVLAISFVVLFLQSGIIWGMIPQDAPISWETHLGGFITGTLLAYFFKDFKFSSFVPSVKETYSPLSSTVSDVSFLYVIRRKLG